MTETSPFRKLPPLTATGITYRLYESPTTGLRGMLMETAEPLCSLHVAIATESDTHDWTHKDDGLPHTLEHAIFMGSELYPFKGILDKLANRSLARGTNAWTATDHTCYTMTSAGHEGCLNLLPIYADHILYPTLSDECFHTEVHHVSGEGEDKGVVYCEMQARSIHPRFSNAPVHAPFLVDSLFPLLEAQPVYLPVCLPACHRRGRTPRARLSTARCSSCSTLTAATALRRAARCPTCTASPTRRWRATTARLTGPTTCCSSSPAPPRRPTSSQLSSRRCTPPWHTLFRLCVCVCVMHTCTCTCTCTWWQRPSCPSLQVEARYTYYG